MPAEVDPIVMNLVHQLKTNGIAVVRTGDRRTTTAANKLLKEAADKAKVEITTSKGENSRIAKVK